MRSQNLASRVRSSGAPFFLFLLCLLAAFARLTMAAPVAIQDASFDTRSLSDGGMSTTLTPWLETGGTGNSNGWIERVSGFAADGQNHLAMNLNHNVWQDLGVTYQANTRYTLTVAVGNRSTFTQAANQSRYILAGSDGTVFATGTLNASTIPVGTFADAPALVFETGSNPSAVGKTIRVRLEARGFGRSHFDKVRLTAASLLPPLATTLPATEVTDSAVLNGTVNSRGLATTVVFEYGLTNSYGSTVSAVPLSLSDDTATAVTATLDGLPPGTTYHYRVVATNEKGTTQGADLTFTTAIPAYLSGLTSSAGTLVPAFSEAVTSYVLQVPSTSAAIRLTPATGSAGATIRVQGVEVASGTASALIPVSPGHSVITVGVTAAGSLFPKNYQLLVIRPPSPFVFTSPDVPAFEAPAFNPTGSSADFALGFAPVPGTNLTVVRNTGQSLIQGAFDNLAHGQAVNLTYGGISYPFVANYFGGTGNDLVLQWGNRRLLAWGLNNYGQLGNGTLSSSSVPVAVDMTGVLASKVPLNVSAGGTHCLAHCADGTVVAWGENTAGQLGNGNTTNSRLPVMVSQTGALAGKTVIAAKAGVNHSLALCSDGTLVAWGNNSSGQLGNGGTSSSTQPVAVDQSGVLAGKKVVALAVGDRYSLVLCSDGTLAAWGSNSNGALGNGSATPNSYVPVLVNRTGVLAGKTVTAISARGSSNYDGNFSLAVCSDGTLVAWGNNTSGQLGNGSTTRSNVPVAVTQSGVLSGRTVVAVAAGDNSSVVLCSNGIMAAWGNNFSGQLGNSSNTNSSVPVLVTQSGVLSGKTAAAIAGGDAHTLALSSDGTLAAWGYNAYGQVGNNTTTNSNAPALVNTSVLSAGERVLAITGGSNFSLALTALPPPPMATTLAASGVGDTGATLNGTVAANGNTTTVSFEYGLTTSYGTTISATPASLSGLSMSAASAKTGDLLPGKTYHFRVVATNVGGTRFGANQTFTTTTAATLSSLASSVGSLEPAFQTPVANYSLTVDRSVDSIRFTPVVTTPGAAVTVAAVPCVSGVASAPVPLSDGSNPVALLVSSPDGATTFTYTVNVTRIPQVLTFGSANAPGLTSAFFDISGMSANLSLDFAPPPGTTFTVLENTGRESIRGEFTNLAHGDMLVMEHGGIFYPFVANYFGGTGNDLVLEWANTRPVAWGGNRNGQLGTGLTTNSSPVPIAVDNSGILNGRTILTTCAGNEFNMALCADGTLASWGTYRQLGNNRTDLSRIPVGVDVKGVLAGKTVVAIAAGSEHSLALCSDGTLATWGRSHGELGTGGTIIYNLAPVAVNRSGVLSGKKVVAIAAGSEHSLALCSDGTLAAWGNNDVEQLGNGGFANSSVPVLVQLPVSLNNKVPVRIAAGGKFNLVLYEDGTMAAWGANNQGQLGIGTESNSSGVVRTGTLGILAGKTVTDIAAGGGHVLALCSDGTLAAWGANLAGQLGINNKTSSPVPVAVDRSGVLAGKTVTNLAAGVVNSLVRCSDGTMSAWGWNYYGTLGNNTTSDSIIPVRVDSSLLKPGERFSRVIAAGSNHSLATVASPPQAVAETLAAIEIGDTRTILKALVHPNGVPTTVSFEYGPTTKYGSTISTTPAVLDGIGTAAASGTLQGLLTNTTYHYRVITTNANGTWRGKDMTFTTSGFSTLAGLNVSAGELIPGFASVNTSYAVTVLNTTDRITLTPVASFPGASIAVKGSPVVSGAASQPINLAVGDNRINIEVSAADGINTQSYTVTITRLPQSLRFESPANAPVKVAGLQPSGGTIEFELAFHPPTGADLTAINQTGWSPIEGVFDNLSQGQQVVLTHEGINYEFAADYFGGDGNDLVLRWANGRLLGWGENGSGQLGMTNSSIVVPTPVGQPSVLSGRVVSRIAVGATHSLVLSADGILTSMGSNAYGQLGNPDVGGKTSAPVLVNRSGPLSGLAVVAVAAGQGHSLALCADGTLAAWGNGTNGRLGNNGIAQSKVPVPVEMSGALAGRRVVAITAGYAHNLALCADGGVVAWGSNNKGQLGDGSFDDALVPVAVDDSGVLAGRRVIAIGAGEAHSLALCEDGTVMVWGDNSANQLGDVNLTVSAVPVAVALDPVLLGRSIVAVATGGKHNLVLLDDGTMAGWGRGHFGQLAVSVSGSNTTAPVTVPGTGALSGKEVIAIATGAEFSMTLCSDNSATGFGYGSFGAMGNGTTNSFQRTPTALVRDNLRAGERLSFLATGPSAGSALAWVTAPPLASVATHEVTALHDASATLNGTVMANGGETTVRFEFGSTQEYSTVFEASPALVAGVQPTPVSFTVNGLLPGKTYHYRVVVTGPGGTSYGENVTFTTSALATLAGLSLDHGILAPGFDPVRTRYITTVPYGVANVAVTPLANHPEATVRVNGSVVESGIPGAPLPLAAGTNAVTVVVNSGDGENVMTYEIAVTRMAERYVWTSADVAQVEGDGFLATGDAPPLALGFAPQAGTSLRLVNNTSSHPISGNFGNLIQGQVLSLEFAGNYYSFIVNYSGGTGNDLTLDWGNTRIVTWGSNTQGQLGDGTLNNSLLPIPVPWPGALSGKHLVDVKAGFQHSLALYSDGSLSIWGNTKWNSSSGSPSIPAVVPVSGALQGRTVVRIAAGEYHNLALCSDGTLVAWGYNYHGQLGNNGSATSGTPVAVDQTGPLAGKQIVDIAAGKGFSFALCSDGTVAGWGWLYGEEWSPQLFRTPARIDMPGGRKVVKLAAGYLNSLALCDDGSLICWGANISGQFGNGTKASDSSRNLAGVNMTGVLSGKTVREMAVGSGSMLVLCSDGTLVSWGSNYYGQLGTGNKTDSLQPVEVNRVGALAGKTAVRVFSGQTQHYAQCGDGTLAAWGHNIYGSLGNGTVTDSTLPVEVSRGNFAEGERFLTTLGPGSAYNHALVLTALALPDAMTLAADDITGVSATLHGIFNANGNQVAVAFEYGLDSGFGSRVEAIPGKNGGTEVFAELSGLKPGTTYHFRIIAESGGGMVRGPAMTFTTLSDNAKLAGLTTSAGAPAPAFEKLKFDYLISVANSTDQISITPVTDHPGAKVKIGGQEVVSGTASEPLPLNVGNNTLTVIVTAEDDITTLTYTLVVTRMPAVLAMEASGVPPVTAEGFFANDLQAMLRLNFQPSFGSTIMLMNNTGLAFIHGRFSNLAHGQRVWLTYDGVSYPFLANYYGGTGNDLVLQWAGTRVAAWGMNNYGQLGDGGNTQRLAPVAVDDTGVLADKTVFAISTGYLHSVALCSDGTLASWGYNVQGQLGDNGSAHQKVPVAVDVSGVLSDKEVVAIASGSYHNLALCSDGTVAAWGFNNHGQLGDGTKTTARTPVLVRTDGVLAGKQVVAVAAGAYQSYALCSDGTLAAWGYNDEGELGDGGNTGNLVPVAVDMSGVLAGRKVSNIAAGQYHALALCTDGTLVSWGYNPRGQLGNSSTADSKSPVAIGSSGALAGKSVIAISAGASHSVALCTDGTLAAWGFNSQSQLGATGITQSTTPVAVAPPARPLAALAAGAHHNLLRFTDGGMAAWGGNPNGQLGSNNTQASATVVNVDTGSLDHGGFIMFAASGCASSHNLAVFAVPVDPPTGLEAWRLENFADMGIGSALAGDCADCDGDGIPNLAEYAFGLDPHRNSADKMPRPERVGNRFELRFSRGQTSPNIEYGAEWSPDLRPGSWRDVPDSGDEREHVFSLPVDTAPRIFMRHRVISRGNAVPK